MTAFWNQTNQAFSCFPWFNDYEVRLSGPKRIVSIMVVTFAHTL
jgi:hypothetical protein